MKQTAYWARNITSDVQNDVTEALGPIKVVAKCINLATFISTAYGLWPPIKQETSNMGQAVRTMINPIECKVIRTCW